jgi:hypothetical protein
MIRNLKTLVLATLALAVAGAASASVASAEATIFRTNNPGQTVLYSGQHEAAVFRDRFRGIRMRDPKLRGAYCGRRTRHVPADPELLGLQKREHHALPSK